MPYSASRLETYRQCPQKFKFTYIDGIKSPTEGIEAFMGSRAHETLEKLYTDLKFCKEVTLESLLDFYRQAWEKEWHDEIRIVREELTPENYLAMGEKCIVDYFNRYHPFDQNRTLGIEYRVEFNLDQAGKHSLLGFVDRISRPRDKVIWIHDYKAKGFLPTQQDLDEDRQLPFYQMAVKALWPDTSRLFHAAAHAVVQFLHLQDIRQGSLNRDPVPDTRPAHRICQSRWQAFHHFHGCYAHQ